MNATLLLVIQNTENMKVFHLHLFSRQLCPYWSLIRITNPDKLINPDSPDLKIFVAI
jgi:hypothetical protein